jgi:hypothetical protein
MGNNLTADQIVTTFSGTLSSGSNIISGISSMPPTAYLYYNLTITNNSGIIPKNTIISVFGSGQITMNQNAQSSGVANFNIVNPSISRKDQDFVAVARSSITNQDIGWG